MSIKKVGLYMAKLIGLFRNHTGIVHSLKNNGVETVCGMRLSHSDKVFWSGKSHINCRKCLKKVPDNIVY
jgi:hypothetical protein